MKLKEQPINEPDSENPSANAVRFPVAQVSKPAVSPISKSAGRETDKRLGLAGSARVWKPAIQQTWKSALHNRIRRVLAMMGAACCLALATGCASHHEKIVFSDDAEVRAAMVSAATPLPALPRFEKDDELKIEQTIFGYLLERHFWDLADYSAVFLQADDTEVKAMIKKYPDHVPPIKLSYHSVVQPHKTPLDADTNKPAMILSADVNEPNADGSVDAVGRWYAGDAVTGFRAFHLQKVNGEWQIAEVQ